MYGGIIDRCRESRDDKERKKKKNTHEWKGRDQWRDEKRVQIKSGQVPMKYETI